LNVGAYPPDVGARFHDVSGRLRDGTPHAREVDVDRNDVSPLESNVDER
jgi:hypothetical protein